MNEKTAPAKAVLEKIAAEYPTPFHLYDAGKIRKNAAALQAAFAWNPPYREYFAIKANPNPAILMLLKKMGCGVDCASYCELMLAEACGFSGDEIMFSSNETPAAEYEYAMKLGANINLDDITHIDFLADHGGIPEKICLRYNPGGEFRLGNTVMGNPGDAKFGMTREQIFESVRRLSRMGVKKFALHSFLASNTTDSSYYPTMARLLFNLARDVHAETGASFFMINLSGGVGIPYRPEETAADIALIGEGVRKAYEEIIVPAGLAPLKIATELGRYMTGPCGWLVSTAVHEKCTHKHYLGLDSCAANLMRPAMYGAYHHITIAGKENAPATEKYDVVGSLCENNDKFAIDRMLPHVDIGDIVVIHDTGAHGFSMGYNYNGKLRSAEVLLEEDGSFSLIRRAETPRDYFATLDFTHVMDGVLKNVQR